MTATAALKPAIALWRKQIEFVDLTTQVQGFCAGRASGKSRVGSAKVCLKARKNCPVMVVSPDANVIEETTWPTFEDVARSTGQWIRGVRSPVHRAFIRTFDGGTTNVVFKGAEKPDKLRGPNKALIWFDECSVISHAAYLTAIACGRWQGQMAPVYMTFTPRGKKHWTFDVFYTPVPDAELLGLPPAFEFDDGYTLHSGEVCIQQRWYRTRPNASLVFAETADNPFAPDEYVGFLSSQYSTVFSIQELKGRFIDIEGLMFKREWFRFVENSPRRARRIRYWDLAATPDGGCFTVGTRVARSLDGVFYIEDVVKGQWGAFERNNIILETARSDGRSFNNEVEIYMEQEPGSGGKEQVQQLIRMLAGFPVFRDLPTGGNTWRMVDGQRLPGQVKITKARPLSAQAEAGNVCVLYGSFTTSLLDALIAFPFATNIDEVDSLASCVNKLLGRDSGVPGKIILQNPAIREPFGEVWRRRLQVAAPSRN